MKDTKSKWFKEAKFGLFIHWGLYSILAGEYKGKKTNRIAEWIMNDLDIPVSEYEKLADKFNPINFSAKNIVNLAKRNGMKYIVFTSKHHEGFAMYNSEVSDYNIVKATPFKRDVLKELSDECAREGIKLGLYYSQAQDWHDKNGYIFRKDNSKKDFELYFRNKCLPQIKELLTNYENISLLWFDTPMDMTKEQSEEIISLVKSIQKDCIVSGRIGNNLGEYMTTGDNFIPKFPYNGDWELPATLNNTWGYNKDDNNWKSFDELLRILLKVNARGGNYLLNIGPKADGTVPEKSVEILDELGEYVNTNKEAIFGTKPVLNYPYEPDNAEITTKDNKLYVHILNKRIRVELINIANKVNEVKVLGFDKKLEFTTGLTCEGVHFIEIEIPEEYRQKAYYCIEIDIEEKEPVFEEIL